MNFERPGETAHEGAGPFRHGLISRATARALRALEAESSNWFLWLPVFFAAGIIVYFGLPFDPPWRLAAAGILAALGLFFFLRHVPVGLALGGAALAAALGFADAKLRTELVRAPVLQSELRYVIVNGYVERFEQRADKRNRLTLRVISLEDVKGGLPKSAWPAKVRITLSSKKARPVPGEAVSVRATLTPPPEPIAPGSFDFGRQAWFKQIGAVGYATGHLNPLAWQPPPPWHMRLWAKIDAVRADIGARIQESLPGEQGAIATALITGDRGGISQEVRQTMRDSGLAHVLAISGLHMAIMAGSVFWLARALLASVPALALRYPIKKWAAGIAIIAATIYLFLSGASVPTVRAWIMMSIVMVAVMADRPAISMRNVALAALVILIPAPESLFQPSFEMSFAAVIGLVAAYEAISRLPRARFRERGGAGRRAIGKSLVWGRTLIGGAALTTLIAGAAVAPFAIYHFHRMTHFGLLANMIAAPLISLLIMPMALLSLLTMPFGLEAWPLYAMGFGIGLMLEAARWVAAMPHAVTIVPSLSGVSLALIALGGLWLCLWQTRLRSLGLVISAIGLAIAPIGKRPDVLIERDGKTAAIRGSEGALIFPEAVAATYSVENWLLADGDNRDAAALRSESLFRCDPLGCIGHMKGKTIALIREAGALEEDCRKADIVIAPFNVPKSCARAPNAPRVIVDREMLKSGGAHSLYFEGDSIRSESVAARRGKRPWSRKMPARGHNKAE